MYLDPPRCFGCEQRWKIQEEKNIFNNWSLLVLGTIIMLAILFLSITGISVNGVEPGVGQRIFMGLFSVVFLAMIWTFCPMVIRDYYRERREHQHVH